jgi:hypothetical protein
MKIRQWALTLMVLGLGSLILPLVGVQFQIFNLLQGAQPAAGITCAGLGALLFLLSLLKLAAKSQAAIHGSASAVSGTEISSSPSIVTSPQENHMPDNPSTPRFCGSCGTPMQASEAFCGNCGAPRAADVAQTPVAPSTPSARGEMPAAAVHAPVVTPASPSPMVAPKAKHTFLKVALGALGALLIIVAAWFAVSSGVFRTAQEKRPPALPKAVAGTLTEFPIDGADLNPTQPTSISTQRLSSNQPPKFANNSLPPGLAPSALSRIGTSITSAEYKSKPQDTPVHVHVVDVNGSSEQAARSISSEIAGATSGMATTGIHVQGITGEQYSGYKLKTPESQTYVLGKANAPIVIVIYAPDAATAAISDRLVRTVGNGGGVTANAAVSDAIGVLPATIPEGIELVEMHTFNVSDLVSPQQLSQVLGNVGQVDPASPQAQFLMPERLAMARYHDNAGKDFNLFVGEYGSSLSAWKTWLLLRGTSLAGKVSSIAVHNTTGLAMIDGGQQYVVFQTGPHLALLTGPAEATASRILQLADALQF